MATSQEWLESLDLVAETPPSATRSANGDMASSIQRSSSLLELELRSRTGVWGQSTTASMQKFECIQKVKRELVEAQMEADSIPVFAFQMMVLLSITAAAAIVLVWELYLRPRSHTAALA
ncbi:hypothetical protein CHLRE_02g103750v5 [Chlamydomonas reinhardtii]|uniref:Uncharacterized protein n=1 Tax=Chlamydomonas reinhardtii TaxID=3055 RepID=A0A2K3E2H3_CHLRE|nr:uncharacterized protein CHLRE_02g103750v5 [Chlamydomonas reinhardtii]PNW86975.1 hypothetical protein CHLRE_02g103750v5 [Chlamydomonas reinhardtii]